MIIINSGIPKSGSTLIFEYQKELIKSAYPKNGTKELFKNSYGGYIETIDESVEKKLIYIHKNHGPFVVKTHTGPTKAIKNLIKTGHAKATFSIRDPRDVIISAMEHGERTRSGGDPSRAFSEINSIRDGLIFSGIYIKTYKSWRTYGNVLFIRYEDMIRNKLGQIKNMAEYFNFSLKNHVIEKIYNHIETSNLVNLNKGTIKRWKTEMSLKDINLCNKYLGADMESMGYKTGKNT